MKDDGSERLKKLSNKIAEIKPMLVSRFGDPHEVEDGVQEVLVRLTEKLNKGDFDELDDDQLMAFTWRAAYNEMLTRCRNKERRREVPLPDQLAEEQAPDQPPPDRREVVETMFVDSVIQHDPDSLIVRHALGTSLRGLAAEEAQAHEQDGCDGNRRYFTLARVRKRVDFEANYWFEILLTHLPKLAILLDATGHDSSKQRVEEIVLASLPVPDPD